MQLTYIIAISLVQTTLSQTLGSKMSWCDYWLKRGVQRSECLPSRSQHWSLAAPQPKQIEKVLAMPICDVVTDWSRCQSSNHCPLGLLCWRQGSPCCTPQQSRNTDYGSEQCPHPKSLGIQCYAKNPINWCNIDRDCHRFTSATSQKCCPSGCGYNMCVRTGSMMEVKLRIAAMSFVPDSCPSMDLINVSCISSGVSWCNSNSQCLQNGVQERSCCPTRCGYNVCLLKLSANKFIIA